MEELEEVAGVGAGRGAAPPATPPATSKQKRRREAEAERGGFGGGGGGGGGGFTAMLRELGVPGARSAEETLAFIEAQVGACRCSPLTSPPPSCHTYTLTWLLHPLTI